MPFNNKEELSNHYQDEQFRDAFARLYTLRQVLHYALAGPEYEPATSIAECIVLTEAGEAAARLLTQALPMLSPGSRIAAIFCAFAHQELFVNVWKSDADTVQRLLDKDIIDGQIRFPWVYERTLYDKFNARFTNQTDKLSPEETSELLKDTPMGVFQLYDVLVGPFGILHSTEHRWVPPRVFAPLWHCSDPGCASLHTVRLTSAECDFRRALSLLRTHALRELGPASEWNGLYDAIGGDVRKWYEHLNPRQLPWLIANAFDESELRLICARLITDHGKTIRDRFPTHSSFSNTLHGAAGDIVQRLNIAETLQCILLASDVAVTSAIDVLIQEGTIKVPPTEIRSVVFCADRGGWFATQAQCSTLGVRFIGRDDDFPLQHLRSAIKSVYSADESDSLAWKLRHVDAKTLDEKLVKYIYETPPEQIISNLFFDTLPHLQKLFGVLKYGYFAVPKSAAEEHDLKQRTLWKLGFGTYSFPPHNATLWTRVEHLERGAITADEGTEEARERVRSIAVNVFVSLEYVLDESLSFTAWCLFSDHFAGTRFKYDLSTARRFTAELLNSKQTNIHYDATGKNTLYPLITGFKLLGDLCLQVLNAKVDDFVRPEEKCPGHHVSNIERFPFRHTMLLLDVDRTEMLAFATFLESITRDLSIANVASVRNRIDHQRQDFPTATELIEMCSRLKPVLRQMEIHGVSPLLYVRQGQDIDAFGRGTVSFAAYNGVRVRLRWPRLIKRYMPALKAPQTIVPSLHLADVFEPLRFAYEEQSLFARRWANSPLRIPRTRPVERIQHTGPDAPEFASAITE